MKSTIKNNVVTNEMMVTNANGIKRTCLLSFDFNGVPLSTIQTWAYADRKIALQRPIRALNDNEFNTLFDTIRDDHDNVYTVDPTTCGRKIETPLTDGQRADQIRAFISNMTDEQRTAFKKSLGF